MDIQKVIEDKLKELGLPDTREGFLQLNYLGDVPEHIDPDIEASFPEKYQLKNAKNSGNADTAQAGNAGPGAEGDTQSEEPS